MKIAADNIFLYQFTVHILLFVEHCYNVIHGLAILE